MESRERNRLPFVVAEIVQHESTACADGVDESFRVEAFDRIEALFGEIPLQLAATAGAPLTDSVVPHLLRCCARFLARDSTFAHKSLAVQVLKTTAAALRCANDSGSSWDWMMSLSIALDKIQRVCADVASVRGDELREAALGALNGAFALQQPTDESAVSDAAKHAVAHALHTSMSWTQLPGLAEAALQTLQTQTQLLLHWPRFLRQSFPGLFSGLAKVCGGRAALRHRVGAFLTLTRVLTAAAHGDGDGGDGASWFSGDAGVSSAVADAGGSSVAQELVRAARRGLRRGGDDAVPATGAQRDDALLAWRVDVLQRVSRVLTALLVGLLRDCARHSNVAQSLALQRQVAAAVLDAVADCGDFLGAALSAELLATLCERLDAAVDDDETGDVAVAPAADGAWLQRRLLRCVRRATGDGAGRWAFRRALQAQLALLWRDRWRRL
eukprot:gene11699-8337_t